MANLVRYLIFSLFISLQFACSDSTSQGTLSIENSDGKGSFYVPETISKAALDQNNISAYIVIDNGSGAAPIREQMFIRNGVAEFTKTGLEPGTYTFTIEFEYSDANANLAGLSNSIENV